MFLTSSRCPSWTISPTIKAVRMLQRQPSSWFRNSCMQIGHTRPYMCSTYCPFWLFSLCSCLFHSLTIATDMTTMAPAFSAVKETIYQNSVGESVLLWNLILILIIWAFPFLSDLDSLSVGKPSFFYPGDPLVIVQTAFKYIIRTHYSHSVIRWMHINQTSGRLARCVNT